MEPTARPLVLPLPELLAPHLPLPPIFMQILEATQLYQRAATTGSSDGRVLAATASKTIPLLPPPPQTPNHPRVRPCLAHVGSGVGRPDYRILEFIDVSSHSTATAPATGPCPLPSSIISTTKAETHWLYQRCSLLAPLEESTRTNDQTAFRFYQVHKKATH